MSARGRVVALLLLAAMAGARAQSPAGEPDVIPLPEDPEPATSAVPVFEDIIVTVAKREQLAREVAGSIAVFDGGRLERLHARDQEDILKSVPGVSLFKEEPNRHRITIRGIAADNGTSQAAGILIDDVPFTDPFIADLSPDLAPFDLETVEVLKGPQGTLFGGSGLAGAIRYVLRPAEPGDWQARGFFTMADMAHGGREPAYGLALNAPVHDRLALRFVGTAWDRPGLVDETGRHEPDVDRSRQTSARALLRWMPTESLDVRGVHLEQRTSTHDLGFVDDAGAGFSRGSTPTASPVASDFSLDQLTLTHDFDGATATSATGRITKFLDIDADTSRLVPATRQFARATVDGFTQELRLASPEGRFGPWQWLVGAFYMRYDTFRRVDLTSDVPIGAGAPLPPAPFVPGTTLPAGGDPGLVARFDLDATAREVALFGEATYAVLPGLEATLGLRGYRTSSQGVATASGLLNMALTGEPESHNHADLREEGLNPKIALRFHWAEEVLLYGLAARGFRFGGIELIGGSVAEDIPPTYRSDRVWLYEAGLRSRWLRGTLAADATGYRMDWSDPQLTQLNESGTLLYIDNVGGARVLGAEVALRYLTPLRGLSLGAAGAYTDARTTQDFTASSGAQVPVGTRWPFTADRQLTAEMAYALQFNRWSVTPALAYSHTGKGYSNIENTVPVFDYATLDAQLRLGLEGLPGAPQVELAATNLLDRRGVASHTVANDVHTVYFIRPLTVSARVTLGF